MLSKEGGRTHKRKYFLETRKCDLERQLTISVNVLSLFPTTGFTAAKSIVQVATGV
jgi:hypothetical protein